ncbi:MAG: CocE/NonD family hydrolase [Acidimicrobiia bacterium]
MRIERDVPVTDDGNVLRADVFIPIEEGTYPVILSYGPDGKGLAFQDGYKPQWDYLIDRYPEVAEGSSGLHQNWEVVDPEKWVPDEYVCVRVDSRGTGRSSGCVDVWSGRETLDLYHCIEWAAAQSWSNGRIGLAGISYYAMNQYQVAALQPPHLEAICPWEGASDWYREFARHGGILCQFAEDWYCIPEATSRRSPRRHHRRNGSRSMVTPTGSTSTPTGVWPFRNGSSITI